jgi:hypothetical protein
MHSHGATPQHENTMIGGTKSANFEQTIPNPREVERFLANIS